MSTDPHRVHAHAMALTCDEWLAVLGFPSACATVGKRCPKWVRVLCQHADATMQTLPGALLEALEHGKPHERTAECEGDAARTGEALGLCIVKGGAGPMVRIMPTPFGFAVWFVHHVRQIEPLLSSLEGAPRRPRIGVPIPARLVEHGRLSAALPKALPPSIHHDGLKALPPSILHDGLKALPPSILHDGPKALPPSIDHEGERGGS